MRNYSYRTFVAVVLAFGLGASSAHAAAPAKPQGVITGKAFLGITGNAVANLTGNANFPNNPSAVQFPAYFEWAATGDITTPPGNWADNYGTQILGYFYPPATGDYVFFLSADDNAELYLSTDSDPKNKKLIARESNWSNPRQYDASGGNSDLTMKASSTFAATQWPTKDPANGGAKITLQAGQAYYIEALSKEGGGGDNLSVAVLDPGLTIDSTMPIPGKYLSSDRTDGPAKIATQPQSQSVDERASVTFRVLAEGTPPYTYQWKKNGADITDATSIAYTVSSVAVTDNNAKYSVAVTGAQGNVTSQEAVLTVIPDKTPPRVLTTKGSPNLTEVVLTFSEKVDPATANVAANYKLSSASGSLNVTAAALAASGTSVTLTTAKQTLGTKYTILVSNLKDTAATPNTIAANTKAAFFPTGKIVEQNGFIVFEAENYDRNLDGLWVRDTTRGNPSGGASMVNPNGAGGNEQNTKLEYDVEFKKAGTYKIWFRASGNDGSDDSAWFHLNGERPAERLDGNSAAMVGFTSQLDFVWRAESFGGAQPMSVDIPSPGTHSVGLARREDGSFFDKFILTTDMAFTPTGFGPAETREGAPGLPTASLTAPTEGQTFAAGANVTLAVTTAGKSGLEIARVQYSANGIAVGEATASPFSFTWSNAKDGLYAIRATAFDEVGQSVITDPVTIKVGTPPPQALFIAAAGGPNGADNSIVARLQSQGWQVRVVGDTPSQTSDANGMSLILVSSTVGSGNVGDKFTSVPVPLINWEEALQDNLLLTTDEANVTRASTGGQEAITIVKADHPLAAGLSAGAKTVVTSPQTFSWGVPGPGATVVAAMADDPTHAAIYAYEKDALLIDGARKAPARRVHFLLTNDTFPNLNPDGLKLFDAAVSWAANITVKPPTQAPKLSVARSATGLTLTFDGTLQSADSVTGPWTDVANAKSPLAVTPTPGNKFYRAKQ